MASEQPRPPSSEQPVVRASQLKKRPATPSSASELATAAPASPTAPPSNLVISEPRTTAPAAPARSLSRTASNPNLVQTAFELPPAVYSPQLLESVIYDLQYYLDWIRQNHIRQTVGAHPKDEPNHSDETVLVIEAWLGDHPATLERIQALLDHLRALKLPEVHIMLAALPNRTQREALVKWFRNNATPHLLISFVADRNLGGGVVVRTPNRVFDYTWKQELLAARDKLAEIVHRV